MDDANPQAFAVPLEDQRQSALEHYDKVSKEACHYSGFVEQAIQSYNPELIEKLQDLVNIQCSDGNWDYCDYMRGMANGMRLMMSIINGESDPTFMDAPAVWGCDKPDVKTPIEYRSPITQTE